MEAVVTSHRDLILLLGLIIKSSLILIACWTCTVLLKRYAARIRHSMWMIATVGLILLPVVSVMVPGWHTLNVRLHTPPPPLHGDTPIISQQVTRMAPGLRPAPPSQSHNFEATESSIPQKGNDIFSLFHQVELGDILLLIWGIGFFIIVGRILIDLKQLKAFQLQLAPSDSEIISTVANQICLDLGIERTTKICVGPHIQSPLTWGLTKPVIALPSHALIWTQEQLRTVLYHEFTHIKRYDYLWNLLSQATCALYWFNPFVWTAYKQAQLEQEKACDEQVLLSGIKADTYAEHLLLVAKSHYIGHRHYGSMAMARHHALQERIKSILFTAAIQQKSATIQSHSLAVGTCIITLFLAGAQIGYQNTEATYVWLEAEEGDINGAIIKEQDLKASDGSYIVTELEHMNAGKENSSWAKFEFEIATPGQYIIWGRVKAPSGNKNSFFVSVNDSASTVWDIFGPDSDNRATGWTWVRVQNREQTNNLIDAPVSYASYDLSAGKHSLTLKAREQGTKIDHILITNDITYRPRGFGQSSKNDNLKYVWLEAEAGLPKNPIVQGKDGASSNGEFVWLPHQNAQENQDGTGELNFQFEVNQSAEYIIWGRVIAPSNSENSFFFSLNDSPFGIWDIDEQESAQLRLSWSWQRIQLRESDSHSGNDAFVFPLADGFHQLTLKGREPGTRIDRLLLTNDMSFIPEGWGTAPNDLKPSYFWVEAEDGMLSPPLFAASDTTASGNTYIEVSKAHDSRQNPPGDGRAIYHLDIPHAGTYLMWSRVRATGDEEDSFWVRMDGGPWIRWNGITHGKTWHWEEIHDLRDEENPGVVSFDLNAGRHLLEIAYREPGTKLDGFLITNDLNFAPASFSNDPIVLKREHLFSTSTAIQ